MLKPNGRRPVLTTPTPAAKPGGDESATTKGVIKRQVTLPDVEPGLPFRAQPAPLWGRSSRDLGSLTRPLLEALAKLADLESTYLAVFDWDRGEQVVRYVFNAGETLVEEGQRIPIPVEVLPETFPGVTSSTQTMTRSVPDSMVARHLGLQAYVSVPVTVARHRLFAMLCGAGRNRRDIGESVVNLMESFAQIIADEVVREQTEASENRATLAEAQLTARARFIVEAEHRLKTSLAALVGFSLTLVDRWEEMSEAQRTEFHAGIARNARLLSNEVDGVLGEARDDLQGTGAPSRST